MSRSAGREHLDGWAGYRKAARAYQHLRERILGGTLPPGTKLPMQSALAADLGVALMTVRKALDRLEFEGLISCRQDCGTFTREGNNQPADRVLAFEAPEESADSYRKLVECSPYPIVVHSEGRLIYANDAADHLFGAGKADELIGKPILDLVHADDRSMVEKRVRRVLNTGAQSELVQLRLIRLDGTVIEVEVAGFPITYHGRQAVQAIMRDVTEQKRAERSLRESEERYRDLFENANDMVYTIDLTGRFTSLNHRAEHISGYSRQEVLHMTIDKVVAPECLDTVRQMIQDKLDGAQSTTFEIEFLTKDGRRVPVEIVSRLLYRDGNPVGVQGTARDITERKRAEQALRESEERFRATFDRAAVGIAHTAIDGRWLLINQPLLELYGYTREELVHRRFQDITHPDDLQADLDRLELLLAGEIQSYAVEKRYIRHDGSILWARVTVSLVRDEGGEPAYTIAVVEDISTRKEFEEQLQHQALHDSLTGLPNRVLLHDRLSQAILSARRDSTSLALLLMDLDRFKEVNDSIGHHAGDLLLQEVACRLRNSLRESDTIARLGGDEFAVVLPSADARGAIRAAANIQAVLRQPLMLDGQRIDIDASIGIALCQDPGDDADTLLRHADVAMYAAKRSGSGHCTYTPDQDHYSPARLAMVADLRRAIEHDQLILHYQPKANFRTGHIDTVEALVRWRHPEHGLIPPNDFIPLAEETGLIEPLTHWVLKRCFRQRFIWHKAGLAMSVAVNLSPRNLRDPHLPATIAWMARSAGVSPSVLIVEITESTLMAEPERAHHVLKQLHDMGVRVAIDDFGTGYSSLAYLKQLPVDEIKIDKSFVLGMTQSGAVIVHSIIDLAHNLGLEVTAEGVENHEAWESLAEMGCDTAQGFHLSRPLPPENILPWVRTFDSKMERPASS